MIMEDAKIGTSLRIKLPNDYAPPLTLDDWEKRILQPHVDAQLADIIEESDRFLNYIKANGWRPTPPTRWQRIKYRITDAKSRLQNAWAALKGAPIDDGDHW